jgi:hypothetical protein
MTDITSSASAATGGNPNQGDTHLHSESALFRPITFGLALPEALACQAAAGSNPPSNLKLLGNAGVVGSIILLKNAAMIWIGWGMVDTRLHQLDSELTVQGKGVPHRMGPMVVAFPRVQYQGTATGEASTSQLIGGESNEDVVLSQTMAMRLTHSLGYPVYVSCSLCSSHQNQSWMAGLDAASVTQTAAALAEKRVRALLSAIGPSVKK